MKILAAEPLRAGSIAWQEESGQWTLTVVCKATYGLAPVTSALAAEPEDLNDRDNHWDDDPKRSVYAPGDLAPHKPHAEVMLVGSAFAPGGEATRALFVRLIVGELDKSIEVFGPRVFMQDGTLREGERWVKMALRYERAAGGPDSWNPVGQRPDVADTYGRRALPNLQPPGLAVSEPGTRIPPIGFGPIAPSWPGRRDKLHRRSWSEERWNETPLGTDVDPTFFQSAPADQRVEALRPDEQIILENLHPKHARMVTKLSGIRPHAKVEQPDTPAWDLALVADTLWIDTDRGICTLTWRGQIPVDQRDEPGRVLIGLDEPGRATRWPAPQAASAVPPPRRRPPSMTPPGGALTTEAAMAIDPAREDELLHTAVDDSALRKSSAVLPFQPGGSGPGLPFQRAPLTAKPPPPPPAVPRAAPSKPAAWDGEDERMSTQSMPAHRSRAAAPSWLDLSSQVAAPPVAPAPAPSTIAPVPAAPAPPPPPPVSMLMRASDPGIGQTVGQAAYSGVLAASNAAAAPAPEQAAPRNETAAAGAPAAAAPAARPIVELIWHDATKIPRLRQNAAWEPLLPPAPPADAEAKKAEADDPEAAEKRARAERAGVLAVLAKARRAGELDAVMAEVGDDGAGDPPLVAVAGELELPFDDGKMLEVLLGAAGSLAAGDKKLKEVVDLAAEVTKTPLGASPEVAAGFVERVRDAWTKANRLLPADYLDVHARRILLDQRAYQRRVLADAEWIRALLSPPGDRSAIPAYLPASLARRLPLFSRFPARLVAEVVPQQDQYETHPLALRVLALARVAPARHRSRPG